MSKASEERRMEKQKSFLLSFNLSLPVLFFFLLHATRKSTLCKLNILPDNVSQCSLFFPRKDLTKHEKGERMKFLRIENLMRVICETFPHCFHADCDVWLISFAVHHCSSITKENSIFRIKFCPCVDVGEDYLEKLTLEHFSWESSWSYVHTSTLS